MKSKNQMPPHLPIVKNYEKLDKHLEKTIKSYLILNKKTNIETTYEAPNENPDISVILVINDNESLIDLTLRSILNQTYQNIEIICVDDCSTDKSLEKLKSYQNLDKRIIIISNKTKRGSLYSRVIASKQSKGRYITFPDLGDAYTRNNCLETALISIDISDYPEILHILTCGSYYDEISSFNDFVLFRSYNPYGFDKLYTQPEIRNNYFQNFNNISGSGFIFDKFISRGLLDRVIDLIGEDVWNQNFLFADDFLLCFIAMRETESLYIIKDISYWRWNNYKEERDKFAFRYEGYKLANKDISNHKILNLIIAEEKLFEITENDEMSLEFRENILRYFDKPEYIKGLVRSIHFERALLLFFRLANWKYSNKALKLRIANNVKKILDNTVQISSMYESCLNI